MTSASSKISPVMMVPRRRRCVILVAAVCLLNLVIVSLVGAGTQMNVLNDVTGLIRATSSSTDPDEFIKSFEEQLDVLDISQDYEKYWKFSTAFNNPVATFDPSDYKTTRESRLLYDPRITMSVYLSHIRKQLLEQGGGNAALAKIAVPFSWQDWVDLSVLNRYLELPEDQRPTCDDILYQGPAYDPQHKFKNPNKNIDSACVDNDRYTGHTSRALLPGFNFKDRTGKKSFRDKLIHAKSYLLSYAPVPTSIVFLTEKGSYEVSIFGDSNMLDSGLFDEFIESQANDTVVADASLENEMLVNSVAPSKSELDFDSMFTAEQNYEFVIPPDRFIYSYDQIIEDYEKRIDELDEKELRHLQTLRYSKSIPSTKLQKSFREVNIIWPATYNGHKVTENGGHYDFRFFNGFVTESKLNEYDDVNEKRKIILHRIIHTWLQFTYKEGIVSFLAHGTLLSWYWNALVFEWDNDIDVQMPIMDFDRFCMKYNNSLIVEDVQHGYGKYYVDCGSYPTHRTKGNGRNNIDARFIDVDSGMYIDITGLALTDTNKLPPRLEKLDRERQAKKEQEKTKDAQLAEPTDSLTDTDISQKVKRAPPVKSNRGPESSSEALERNKELQIYNCRNNHFYTYSELSPLKLSMMEGSPCLVPHDFTTVLNSEYNGGLRKKHFNNHLFMDELRFWVSTATLQQQVYALSGQHVKSVALRKFYNSHKLPMLLRMLGTDELLKEFYITHKTTKMHMEELALMNELTDLQKKERYYSLMEEYKRTHDPMRKSLHGYTSEVVALGGYHPQEDAAVSTMSETSEELDKVVITGKSQSNAGARRIQKVQT
ncbi:hypothetical protein KL928_001282 [Ogataea angusta]|uniref:LicD/FKTN/FKRP nucleotidyltransferase domain-containing protein n=1 Tax=Pichia angusta TaxID=870730 RepID=A0AAN6DKJ7_PICAN|nr:uncharacterized protein KL928_001282 [Ogataea angusta]KAG7821198.1 hypothetical protein KL928_001282 [Ogataea angusta]KAG7851608.1 hypothetical protein KL941_001277 [Ogataea angusta]